MEVLSTVYSLRRLACSFDKNTDIQEGAADSRRGAVCRHLAVLLQHTGVARDRGYSRGVLYSSQWLRNSLDHNGIIYIRGAQYQQA